MIEALSAYDIAELIMGALAFACATVLVIAIFADKRTPGP